VGVALSISLRKQHQGGLSETTMLFRLGRRAILLFLIGTILVNLPALIETGLGSSATFIVMGTLQRISIAYLIAGIVCVFLHDSWGQLTAGVVVLAIYSLVAFLVPVPGFSPGNFTDEGNAIGFLDRELLGAHSGHSHPILSALSASATVLLGSVTGKILSDGRPAIEKLRWLILIGALLLVVGKSLQYWIPAIMFIWTPSFCLVMAGIATLAYAFVFWFVEVKRMRYGTKPLSVFGMNPLVIWVGHSILQTLCSAKGFVTDKGDWHSLWSLLYETVSSPFSSPHFGTLVFALLVVLFWGCVANVMYLKKWIVRL
jgi:predicted acyltransferase